ncbi:DNA repair protein XRCC2 [Eurosta solidaginis]|uniref:DNA repair protein XRCC2 n=1 Tax=Eurosta solidaginis TaxID=178769 RepID=UPI003530E2A5
MACKVFNAFEGCIGELANQRLTLQDIDTELFPDGAPLNKSLIEISGSSEAGKSMLLWRLMIRCLPPTYFGGRNGDVIFIDLRHKFECEYFAEQIKHFVISSGEPHTLAELDGVAEKCLDSLHLLNCYTPKHFEAALELTEALLIKHTDCALIAIEGLDAFYWLDTYARRQRMQIHYSRNVERLRNLCERHGICCAYTVDANYLAAKRSKGVDGSEADQCACAPNVKVDHKLYLERRSSGERYLNGIPVEIRDNGLHFVKAR